MSDELPPNPADTDDGDAAKAETIRITLPPKPEQATTVKRETVRINLPGKPAFSPPPASTAPKKETTKIVTAGADAPAAPAAPAAPMSPPPPPSGARPFAPPPPRPPSQAGMPLPPSKPMSGINPPPKPPGLGARPTVPLKPAPAPAPSAAAPRPPIPSASGVQPSPVTMKAAAPKKETARITLPAEGSGVKPGMPKATVKMQQTQPLVSRPAPSLTKSAISPAPVMSTSPSMQVEAAPDGMVNVLAIIALVISLISLALVFLAWQATAVS